MRILNKKEIKSIYRILENQFGIKELGLDCVFLQDEDNLLLTDREAFNTNHKKLNIKKIGIRFGRIIKDKIILSIEGSQLIGDKATKNIVTLSNKDIKDYMLGINIEKDEEDRLVLIKHEEDFYGSAKITNHRVNNNIPKNRRLK